MNKRELKKELEKEIDLEISDDSQDREEITNNEDIVPEVMTIAEALKRINQLSRFIGKIKARKRIYETMLKQEHSVSNNVQALIDKALVQLEVEAKKAVEIHE